MTIPSDPPVELRDPVEICGARGDLLLAHVLLGHNKGGNTSARTRRTIYWPYANEWGARVRILGGRGRAGHVTPLA